MFRYVWSCSNPKILREIEGKFYLSVKIREITNTDKKKFLTYNQTKKSRSHNCHMNLKICAYEENLRPLVSMNLISA